MKNVIGVCGFIGCGKGTVGDILVSEYGYKKLSFADRLKDSAAVMFNWPRDLLEGDTKESRDWREQPDPFWSTELGYEMTPRLALQLLGTDCMRKGFDNDIWVLTVKRHIMDNPNTKFVIPDVRFPNERSVIQSLNGEVWQVRRGEQPQWIDAAISDNENNITDKMKEYNVHESEWRWIAPDAEFNQIINNSGTLEDLHNIIKQLII